MSISLRFLRSRTASTLAVLALVAAALLTVPAVAGASPYPPTNPSSSVAPTSVSRDPGSGASGRSTNDSGHTASTGFATMTATGIALALLGGGLVLVLAGRRRRRA